MIRNGHGTTPFVYSNSIPPLGASPPTESLEAAARIIRAAENVCVLTGAGISAESGVPTFRDALTGLWAQFDAQELATPEAFARQPDLVWSWYAMRAAQIQNTRPNAGHFALSALAAYVPHFTLLTQNVDDLHVRSGISDVVSLHGNLLRARCSGGCDVMLDMSVAPAERAPSCSACGELMRPDVVWFGEELSSAALERARTATFACDVFLSVGTSNLVEPAASLPWLAAAHGATVIVVNMTMEGQRRGPSILQLRGTAGATLTRVMSMAFAGRKPRCSED
ncbi:MAG: NAD-dependent protein deacylase [Gemmatimonadaceae bacterium]